MEKLQTRGERPGAPGNDKLSITAEVPPHLRELAQLISAHPLLGDPDPASLSSIEVERARSHAHQLGLEQTDLASFAELFRQKSPDLRESKVAEVFGPPRLDENGEVRRSTRIICTIGPKCSSPEILASMIQAGMDVARLNFSHIETLEDAKELVVNLRKAMELAGRKVVIMGDLPGPKIRIGSLEQPIQAAEGARIRFGEMPGALPLTPPSILADLKPGERLFIDDGKIKLEVEAIEPGGSVTAKVLIGGLIKPRKGLNLPDSVLAERVPTARDREKLKMMKALGIRVVAPSFIETPEDVENVRSAYNQAEVAPIYEAEGSLQVVGKFERPSAIRNARALYEVTDAAMIARGDLAVELGDENVPAAQQYMHDLAVETLEPCGTATQMASSMQTGDRPLRAEVADIAFSVMQRASFVMTSEETAMAEDPVNTVRWMDKIVAATETSLRAGKMHGVSQEGYSSARE